MVLQQLRYCSAVPPLPIISEGCDELQHHKQAQPRVNCQRNHRHHNQITATNANSSVSARIRVGPLSVEEYENEFRQQANDVELVERIFCGSLASNELRAALWPYLFGLVEKRGRFVRQQSRSNGTSHTTSNGTTNGTSHATTNGISNGTTNGSTNGISNGTSHTNANGTSNGTSNSTSNGISNGTTNGISKGTSHSQQQQHHHHLHHHQQYVYVEHEDNIKRWNELERLYLKYERQWKSIMPDQELRFSTFRERKSLIERDVIRCDRLHNFYADNTENLNNLTTLLMTYMMYDFDIGYLQGMSDLAAPILYVFNGDLVKSFWVFVEVMKLFRSNFEYSQKTIHFQLNCLFRLIKLTDPKLAHYLNENECSNCFFVFRCIVCLFKRELMKNEDENDYSKVLSLWDTIWSVQRRQEVVQDDMHRFELTETEKFILSLCLSLIRRERNQILLGRLDSSDIHQHFINPHLNNDLDNFIGHAYEIYHFLNTDCDLQQLVRAANELSSGGPNNGTPLDLSPDSINIRSGDCCEPTDETYDLLKDYLIISPTC